MIVFRSPEFYGQSVDEGVIRLLWDLRPASREWVKWGEELWTISEDTGEILPTDWVTISCPGCGGTGEVCIPSRCHHGRIDDSFRCPRCGGSDLEGGFTCPECDGAEVVEIVPNARLLETWIREAKAMPDCGIKSAGGAA